MPLKPGKGKAVVSENFHDFRHGRTFAHTAKKFGKKRAQKQMVAAVLNEQRHSIASISRTGRK
jgi:hypothetical protein